jgi:hypothetical protein
LVGTVVALLDYGVAFRGVLLIACLAFACPLIARGNDNSGTWGTGLTTNEALSQSDTIFVGTVIRATGEEAGFGWRGADEFAVIVSPSKVLQGSANDPSKVWINEPHSPYADPYKHLPKIGASYFFVTVFNRTNDGDRHLALRVLPVTEANKAVVMDFIRNRGKTNSN